jgi:hypothetical protein
VRAREDITSWRNKATQEQAAIGSSTLQFNAKDLRSFCYDEVIIEMVRLVVNRGKNSA